MKCRYCGAQLREGTTFCHECGRPIYANDSQTDNPYVLITGSKIDLNEKTEIYQKAKTLYLKTIQLPFTAFIPIFGLSYLRELEREVIEAEDKLLSFENQENIVNAILTDIIWEKLYKIERRIRALIRLNFILLFVLIAILFALFFIAALRSKIRSFF